MSKIYLLHGTKNPVRKGTVRKLHGAETTGAEAPRFLLMSQSSGGARKARTCWRVRILLRNLFEKKMSKEIVFRYGFEAVSDSHAAYDNACVCMNDNEIMFFGMTEVMLLISVIVSL